MQVKKMAAIASLAGLFLSAPAAHAELQTWRLTSTVNSVDAGFTPPPFAQLGNVFDIDYVIDTETPSFPGWDGMFSGAIKSFSVNGVTSQADGYISATGSGLNAINVWPISSRMDGIDFLSFNNFSGFLAADVASALHEFSAGTPAAVDLRVDFGDDSIRATPSSFAVVVASVPEPSPGLLLLAALPLALLRKRGSHRA